MTSDVLYDVKNVTRIFTSARTQVTGVSDVSLTVRRGQRLGIVGESGSGKSTLIKMMAALDQPTAGSIWFDNERIDGRRNRELGFLRARVQLVFQDPRSSLNPRMKVGSIITEPLSSPVLKGRADVPSDHAARLCEVLDAVGLPSDSADRYPHEFSGGQRQRIAIARALAPRPDVLIADEPVSALDVSVRAQVMNLLLDLVAQLNLTMIFVSHDLHVVRHLCDSVVVLRRGVIEEHGDIETVYRTPASNYTKELLTAMPKLRVTP